MSLPLWARRELAYRRRCADLAVEGERIQLEVLSVMVFKIAGSEDQEAVCEVKRRFDAMKAQKERVETWRS